MTEAPKLRVDRVSVSGTTIPQTVLRVLRLNSGRLDVCYADSLRRGWNTGGRHEVGLEIRRDGQGVIRSGSSSLADPALVACLEGVLASIRFARPEGGVPRASYAFELDPERGVHTVSELSFGWASEESSASTKPPVEAPQPTRAPRKKRSCFDCNAGDTLCVLLSCKHQPECCPGFR